MLDISVLVQTITSITYCVDTDLPLIVLIVLIVFIVPVIPTNSISPSNDQLASFQHLNIL
jgi:hypothetical protein